MLAKNDRVTLACDRLGAELEGVCTHEGMTVFAPGALPGERFEAQIVKVQPRYAFARVLRRLNDSPERHEPPCPVYAQCGGCAGQHMSYELTLEAKRRQVIDCLSRIGGLTIGDADVPPVLGADEPWHGRNKTSLPVSGAPDAPRLGFYRRRSHDVVEIADCPAAMNALPGVISAVKAWMMKNRVEPYNELTFSGLLRHVIARQTRKGDVLVLLAATSERLPDVKGLVSRLQNAVPGLKALHVSENRSRSNVILGRTCRKLWGDDAIVETLLGLQFEISPLSFFQVNTAQTERLYRCALDFAALQPGQTAVDAYAGAGTIALQMAKVAERVVGIEIVPQAVESARRNVQRNGITNAEFHTAAVEALLPQLVQDGLRPDVIVLDPPRKGVEPAVIDAVLQAAPKRVVYVSCHVPTQARDVAALAAGGYRFAGCQPVDLFCWAGGVENVLCLVRD